MDAVLLAEGGYCPRPLSGRAARFFSFLAYRHAATPSVSLGRTPSRRPRFLGNWQSRNRKGTDVSVLKHHKPADGKAYTKKEICCRKVAAHALQVVTTPILSIGWSSGRRIP